MWASFPGLRFGTRLRVNYVIMEDCLDVVQTQLLTGYMEMTISICKVCIASVGWKQARVYSNQELSCRMVF